MPHRRRPFSEKPQSVSVLALAALGIVFGDIGTSPLYAFKACFSGYHAVEVSPANVLGVLSMVFWSLTVVISLKYMVFVMRADNHGEGGIFALFSLLPVEGRPGRKLIVIAALFGAALLYGDGFITPAISVLSALEGLSMVTSAATPYVVPLTCGILVVLFLVQRFGTEQIGRVFGPIMLLWFLAIALSGLVAIVDQPGVLYAVNPAYAIEFFANNGQEAAIVLGAVVLCVTGAEALYADMGHFGRTPIRMAWYLLAMPALLINYFGQGAMLITDPSVASSSFYALIPQTLLLPMVVLSTCATVIASQAVISGVFSITRQAIQLGWLPRLHILHTSAETEGQIYCPEANWFMAVICLLLVVSFESSADLAGAYGIAITSTMLVTTGLFAVYLVRVRGWGRLSVGLLTAFFLVFDLAFFAANLTKLWGGGWIPLTVALQVIVIMMVWDKGRKFLTEKLAADRLSMDALFSKIRRLEPYRTPGTGVFLSRLPEDTPPFLTHMLHLTNTLPEKVVLVTYVTEPVPRVNAEEKVVVDACEHGVNRLIIRIGFAETPNLPRELLLASSRGISISPVSSVYYLGRETFVRHAPHRLWKILFQFMSRNAMRPALYFRIPTSRVIEIGMHLEL